MVMALSYRQPAGTASTRPLTGAAFGQNVDTLQDRPWSIQMKPFVFAFIASLASPVCAQDARALLDEARIIALPLTDLNDWARAVEAIVQERAAQGDIDLALALMLAAPSPSVLGSLNVAIVNGALDGPGPAMAARLADDIADPGIRSLAQADIVAALTEAGDRDGALAAFASMDPDGTGVKFAVDDVVRILIADGDRAAAETFANGLTDPDQRANAQFWLARAALQVGDLDTALQIMAAIPVNDIKDELAGQITGALAQVGRWPEAEVMYAALTDPFARERAAGFMALAGAAQGDVPAAVAMLDRIESDPSREHARTELARQMIGQGDLPGALALIAVIEDPMRLSIAQMGLAMTLAEQGRLSDATDLASAMTDERARSQTMANIIRQVILSGDAPTALSLLPQVTNPGHRPELLNRLIAAGADVDGALLAETLTLARATPDPSDRARALVAVAAALRRAAD
jgi:tetratricopeptide (TPR) repeat protein